MLYLLPDELLVAILEHCDQKTRKSLSLVSRRLRNPSQHIIFKTMNITRNIFGNIVPGFVFEGSGEHCPEVIQNDRFLSYIQTFNIPRGNSLHYLRMDAIELLFTALHRMQRLRDIKLSDILFTTTMLDRLCEVLSARPYTVELRYCVYPADYIFQQATLKIHRLWLEYRSIGGVLQLAESKLLVAIIERSLSSIASLTLSSGLGLLAYLGTMPRLTSLNIQSKSARNDETLRNFLVANPQIVELTLDGVHWDLSLLPPSALPNLRTIRVAAVMIQHLLQGRPVVKVEINMSLRFNFVVDGLHALSRSATPIVELTLHFPSQFTPLCEILYTVVEAVPRLERIWLSFHSEVRSVLHFWPSLTTPF